jgi:hypothetical protein
MRNISLFFSVCVAAFMISCEGPAGPPGFDGRDGLDGLDGLDGITVLGQVFEIEGSFTFENEYTLFYEFPLTVEVFESDLVFVYILWDQTEDGNGDPVDIWRLLPQTRILNQGLLQYNYDHTFFDVSVFLESDFDLGTLLPGDTDNQIFRIAVMPAEYGQGSKIDRSNLESVMNTLGVTEKDIRRVVLD